jgi:hypothetical protein
MLERLEKRPRATLAEFSPPIFTGTTSVSWFHVSPLPPQGNASGPLYRTFLGQAEQSGVKTNGIGGLTAKRARVVRPGRGPMPPVLIWALVAPSRTSSSHTASHVKILMPEKASVNLSSGRSLKHQNT